MDVPVNPRWCWRRFCLIAAAWLSALPAMAQELADPTRPATAPLAAGAVSAQSGPVLQWVYVSPSRLEAMISDRVVHVGDRLGKAQVVKISESSVVLRSASGLQTLRLFQGMDKKSEAGEQQSVAGDHSRNQR